MLAGFIDAGGVSSWKYADRKLTVAGFFILVVIEISTTLLVGRFVTDQNEISIMGICN